MRTVFVGASKVSVETAKSLIKKGHEVVIIETNKDKLDDLSEKMDCSFLHGDGSQPNILREVNPEHTDFLFCLTNSDQANLIASLVGRSLGFKRVVTSIGDSQFEGICTELGLKDTINPSRTISRYLADMVAGEENVQLSTIIKDEARFFTFKAKEEDAIALKDLDLPDDAKVICYYRDENFSLADAETKFHPGDEIVILTHSKNMPALEKRWQEEQEQEPTGDSDSDGKQKSNKEDGTEP
jgi:trk system potassium uptake protein TrkA